MPIGVPITVASSDMSRLPKMALARPPALPGGGVVWVNMVRLRAGNPWANRVHSIHTSQNRPNSTASMDMPRVMKLTMRRRRYSAALSMDVLGQRALALGELVQQDFRQGQHHEGDQEQNQPEFYQRGGV